MKITESCTFLTVLADIPTVQTITSHRVQFGELAGPLVSSSTLFDWQLISTQAITNAADDSFEGILEEDGIPYAPVVNTASVARYPAVGDTIGVEATPTNVGDSSVELTYDVVDDDGATLATAQMTHVTIGPDGSALSLPDSARASFEESEVSRSPPVGPGREPDQTDSDALPSFSSTTRVRSPLAEGATLAYFEEYPRLATIAIEEHVERRGADVADLYDGRVPFRMRDWRWEFESPVRFQSTLEVECDVIGVDRETVRVEHTLSSDGRTSIRGTTDYGCFDEAGEPTAFDERTLELLEGA
ncbi:Acyl-CoA thioesterase FadM [Halostagnicola kamekurae]|uniref:Acyl-CoA thioesterase FadM n=1 Tax=Halostagnicola kamekurae TaxID=619731 RepID=A0A1I6TN87_9EURY|nr:Acyl-CoA thioesterase FadM [Halostagnicola kamekurae]